MLLLPGAESVGSQIEAQSWRGGTLGTKLDHGGGAQCLGLGA